MRVLALMAFFALQLSVFTCGFDIHVHAMDSADTGYVAEHFHDENSKHNQDSEDHKCHVHASHTFAAFDVEYIEGVPPASAVEHHVLSEPSLKKIPFLIEHPPKFFRS